MYASATHPDPGLPAQRRLRAAPPCAVAALLALVASASVQADMPENALDAPWNPPYLTSLDDDPYGTDPAFNHGLYYRDDFAVNLSGANQSSRAFKTAKLSDGSFVVAALVKNPAGNQTNGYWNLGLLRYSATGQRLQWSNPDSAYAHFNDEYVVYPKSPTVHYRHIRDVKAIDGRIVVLLENQFAGGSDTDALVAVFGEDGSHKDTESAFQTSSADFAGGLAVYRTSAVGSVPQVLVTGSVQQASGIRRPYFSRFDLESDGSLTRRIGPKVLNTHWCDDASRDCRPAGIALGNRGLFFAPSIYVVNRYYQTATDQQGWSIAITKITSNGDADPDWPGLWWYNTEDGSGGAHYVWPVDIAVKTTGLGLPSSPYRDQIYVISEFGRSCGNGVLASRFDENHGYVEWAIFGGSAASGALCSAIGSPADYPHAVAIDGNRLAIVGHGTYEPLAIPGQPVPEPVTDAWVAVADISDGGLAIRDMRDFSYVNADNRTHHSGLWGIASAGSGRFVVTGDGRYKESDAAVFAGKQFMLTLGIAPDRIFGDGFED